MIIGGMLIAAAAGLFLRAWLPVLTGDRVLIGVDILQACCLPWKAEHPMQAQNPLVGDTVLEVLPWQQVAADAFRQGRLPLWDAFALSGKPLLAGGLASVFSPFSLLAVPFPAATGLSLGMLAKLWVAGAGMAVFLRLLGACHCNRWYRLRNQQLHGGVARVAPYRSDGHHALGLRGS